MTDSTTRPPLTPGERHRAHGGCCTSSIQEYERERLLVKADKWRAMFTDDQWAAIMTVLFVEDIEPDPRRIPMVVLDAMAAEYGRG